MKTLKSIMLIDDDADDIFLHTREINRTDLKINIIAKDNARDALVYLKSDLNNNEQHPDLIFLDINMPAMNGWEFLDQYNKLDKSQQSRAIIIMLSTSRDPNDRKRAANYDFVVDYIFKPLTQEQLETIISKYFLKP